MDATSDKRRVSMRRVALMHGGTVAPTRSFERSYVGGYGAGRDPMCDGIRSGGAKAREHTSSPPREGHNGRLIRQEARTHEAGSIDARRHRSGPKVV